MKIKQAVKYLSAGLLISTSLMLIPQMAEAGERIKVAVLTPAGDENPFWRLVTKFMVAVAEDLDIDLNVVVSKENTISLKRDSVKIVSGSSPDFLLTPYWGDATKAIFPLTEENGIKLFIFNSDVFKEHVKHVGQPRGKYRNWIGHMSPDDKQAGYTLGKILVTEARRAGKVAKDNNVHVFGFGGHDYSTASMLRSAGFDEYISMAGGVTLHETVYAHWRIDLAEKMTAELYDKYPGTSVIWAASDGMSIGAINAMKSLGKISGKDYFTGGIDWSEVGVESVAKGEMTATIGGHFMEGGWALVLIHDYAKGIDFVEELGVKIPTPMQALTAANVKSYQDKMHPEKWSQIDFKQFSKVYNKKLTKYDFSLETMLK